MPSGDVLAAVDRVLLTGEATIADPTTGSAPAIKYRQVEVGAQRRPLPFVVEYTDERRERLELGAGVLAGLIPAVGASGTLPVAADLLATRAGRGAADVAAWTGARTAAPLLGSLAEGLGGPIRLTKVEATVPPEPPVPGRAASAARSPRCSARRRDRRRSTATTAERVPITRSAASCGPSSRQAPGRRGAAAAARRGRPRPRRRDAGPAAARSPRRPPTSSRPSSPPARRP